MRTCPTEKVSVWTAVPVQDKMSVISDLILNYLGQMFIVKVIMVIGRSLSSSVRDV